MTIGEMWHDMDSIWLVKQVLQLLLAVVVDIVSRSDISIDAHHRHQPNKSKLVLYKPLL